jgi:pimeloyl-ACP methyl ester carboxylesterase
VTHRFHVVKLVWSLWPFSLREAGWRNDNHYYETMELPSREITVPTLIMHGTEDYNAPFSNSERLAQQIPGSQLHAIEGAGHMVAFSHEEEVSSLIASSLRSLALNETITDRAIIPVSLDFQMNYSTR